MKRLVCEMCNGSNLIKENGVYVCQNCGTRYSVDEAKKMMTDGAVEVSGTVKLDETSKIDNYFLIAESAYEGKNFDETEEYCNKIIEVDPKNVKAWLLKGKAAGWESTVFSNHIAESVRYFENAIMYASEEETEQVSKSAIRECINLIQTLMRQACTDFQNYPTLDNETKVLNLISAMRSYDKLTGKCREEDFRELFGTVFSIVNGSVCAAWKNQYTTAYLNSPHPEKDVWVRFMQCCGAYITILQGISVFPFIEKERKIQVYKNLVYIETTWMNSRYYEYSDEYQRYLRRGGLSSEVKKQHADNVMIYHNNIHNLDPSYIVPHYPKINSGCYVATAVYGSYDCPQVWTLRRYRDYFLSKTRRGRIFIRAYYAVSPTLVRWFGRRNWFQKMWRGILDRVVGKLNADGIEDTPYEDMDWS